MRCHIVAFGVDGACRIPLAPARAQPGGAPRLDGLGGGLAGGRRVERAELVRVAG